MSGVKFRVDDIVKSEEDRRLYRGLQLNNDMKVLLISDVTTDKSAASMNVNVGYLSDPEELPGLAHFCEHMLFLGTEKYPSENEYDKHLSEHGGACNAATSTDYTYFYFDIVPEHLAGTLDRFAQFFLCPLFTESATEREVNAVNSEHEKNISNDFRRLNQLEKSAAKKTHPHSKFGTGNKQTLNVIPKAKGINVRMELLKFHDKWYSSNIMSLAVLGRESLDELEKIVVDLFSGVKNKNVVMPSWPELPFGPEQLKVRSYVVPVKDVRKLRILFPIPDLQEYYKAAPGHYVSRLLRHEGPGSLLSMLRERSWCNSVDGGARATARGFGFFGVDMDLTEEGIEHVDDIVKLVFQYINMLKLETPQKWIFEEYRNVLNTHFRFKDKESPQGYVSEVVHDLHKFPLKEVLCGYYLITEWRPDLIEMVLKYLNPDNMRVVVVSQKFESIADKSEEWYGTKYRLEVIPEDTIATWKQNDLCESLKLPPKNEFIATDFSIAAHDETSGPHPTIILDTPLFRVWFKQDDEFLLPKENIYLEFVSPLAYLDPLSCNMTSMFVKLIKDALNEYAYAAGLAGLYWGLTDTKYGMILSIGGYNNKQAVLLDKIIEKLTNFKIDPKRFDILKENYIRTLKNFEAEQPCQHAVYYLAVLLEEHVWTIAELLASAEHLTLEKVEEFIPHILSKTHIECLIHGNTDKKTALNLVQSVEERLRSTVPLLPLLPRQLLRFRALQLVDRSNFVYEVQNRLHRSSCTAIYYQCSLESTHANMLLELLVKIIEEPCFNILRTKEQLGYVVKSDIWQSNGEQGLGVIVQSDRHPSYIDKRIEAFLNTMCDHVRDLSTEEFERHKEALAARRLEKPKRLSRLSARFWSEIKSQQYNFDRPNIEVAHLRTLKKQDVVDFTTQLIHYNAPLRHKLAVHVVSTAEGGAGTDTYVEPQVADGEEVQLPPHPTEYLDPVKIEDITKFKSSQGMFPLVQPFINIGTMSTNSKL